MYSSSSNTTCRSEWVAPSKMVPQPKVVAILRAPVSDSWKRHVMRVIRHRACSPWPWGRGSRRPAGQRTSTLGARLSCWRGPAGPHGPDFVRAENCITSASRRMRDTACLTEGETGADGRREWLRSPKKIANRGGSPTASLPLDLATHRAEILRVITRGWHPARCQQNMGLRCHYIG